MVNGVPACCFSCAWDPTWNFEQMGAAVGACASQTCFEVLVLVLAVELWGDSAHPTVVLGDNVAALQLALDFKGKGGQAWLAQALAILVVSRTLHLAVGHLPSEANEAADALSRQAEPGNVKPWPFGPEVVRDTPSPQPLL